MFRVSSLVVLLLFTTIASSADHPAIMVTIKPFYNITAAVMQNVAQPTLLLKANSSPHDFHLKPSDAQIISDADLVIWGGTGLEPYMQKPIASLAKANLDLAQTPGLELLPLREDQNWQHDHSHDHHHAHYDPHYWLSPENAIILATSIAEQLADLNPTYAEQYRANATAFAQAMRTKELVWKDKLEPYKLSPYIVGHDAFQYFNNYFELDGVGSITLNPELPPSIKHMQDLQELLRTTNVTCIFSEPQFSDKIVQTLIAGTNVHTEVLDPLGQDQNIGPTGYFILMDNIVDNFVECNQQTIAN